MTNNNEESVLKQHVGIDVTLRGVARAYEIINAQNARNSLLKAQKTNVNSNNMSKE